MNIDMPNIISGVQQRALVIVLVMFGLALIGLNMARTGVVERTVQRAQQEVGLTTQASVLGLGGHQGRIANVLDGRSYRGSPAKIAVPKIEYASSAYRDPFLSPLRQARIMQARMAMGRQSDSSKETGVPDLRVQGIVWGGMQRQAIVNDMTVSAGDVVQGVKIVSIDPGAVIVELGGVQIPYIIHKTTNTLASGQQSSRPSYK